MLGCSLGGVAHVAIGTSDDATALNLALLHVGLELQPDRAFKVKQEPLSHRAWLAWLEPSWKVALVLHVLSLEAKRYSHEVRADALLTEVKELVAILDQARCDC